MPPPSAAAAASKSSKSVKKGIDAGEQRRRREDSTVALRKEKREEGLLKRRNTAAAGGAEAVAASAAGAGAGADAAGGAASAASVSAASADPRLEDLPKYCQAVHGAVPAEVLVGVTCIRRLLSKESQPPVQEVLKTGVLARLVQLLGCDDAKVQFEAAWALTNIASTEYTQTVVEAGAVPPLVRGMMAADSNVREQCLWCIGNVSGDGTTSRDTLIGTPGCVDALLQNLAFPSGLPLLRNATWTLSNLCRGKPSPQPAAVAAMLPALNFLSSHADQQVTIDALWGLSYLTDGDEATIKAVADTPGVVKRCVDLLAHEALVVVTPALRVVGNFISGTDLNTQAAIDAGALRQIVPLLEHSKRNVRREACWALSNVAAGTLRQISSMMAVPGLVQGVIHQLRAQAEWMVRKEACWVIFNVATTGTPEHVLQLVAHGVVEPLASMLEADDPRLLIVALDAISAMLDVGAKLGSQHAVNIAELFEEAGALDNLDNLQSFHDADVYSKCVAIIEKHFSASAEEEDGPPEGGDVGASAGSSSSAFAPFGAGGAGASNIAGGLFFGTAPAVQPQPGFSFGGSSMGTSSNANLGFGAGAFGAVKTPPPALTAFAPGPMAAAAPQPFNFGGFSFS